MSKVPTASSDLDRELANAVERGKFHRILYVLALMGLIAVIHTVVPTYASRLVFYLGHEPRALSLLPLTILLAWLLNLRSRILSLGPIPKGASGNIRRVKLASLRRQFVCAVCLLITIPALVMYFEWPCLPIFPSDSRFNILVARPCNSEGDIEDCANSRQAQFKVIEAISSEINSDPILKNCACVRPLNDCFSTLDLKHSEKEAKRIGARCDAWLVVWGAMLSKQSEELSLHTTLVKQPVRLLTADESVHVYMNHTECFAQIAHSPLFLARFTIAEACASGGYYDAARRIWMSMLKDRHLGVKDLPGFDKGLILMCLGDSYRYESQSVSEDHRYGCSASALSLYTAASSVWTKDFCAPLWALLQFNSGMAAEEVGDYTGDLNPARSFFRNAAAVWLNSDRSRWSDAEFELGNTFASRGESANHSWERQTEAIKHYELALSGCTRDSYPMLWGIANWSKGHSLWLRQAYWSMSHHRGAMNLTPQQVDDLRRSVPCFKNALACCNVDGYPLKTHIVHGALWVVYYQLAEYDGSYKTAWQEEKRLSKL